MNIAIDGPAGAGKSTIAKKLAQSLNFVYLDTGAMYRAIGLKAYKLRIDYLSEEKVSPMLDNTKIEIKHNQSGSQVLLLDGVDVSTDIRQNFVSKLASDISKLKCVRLKMVELQREIAAKGNTILDGRDIGTFVLPNAEFKIFLTASVEERATRRFKELKEKSVQCDFESIKADIIDRDYNDSHREFAPLKKAEDAIEVDTTKDTIDEVVEKLLKIIK